jgi:hypothetical protein
MGELEQPVRRAWRRLRAQRFLDLAVGGLALGLLLGALVIGLGRFYVIPVPGPVWWPAAAGAGLGLVVAALIAALSGPDRMAAAVAVDHAFALQERLSTALSLPAEIRETPAGRAILADAAEHASRVDIAERFGLRRPRRAWAVLLPGLLAGGLMFMPAEWVRRVTAARRPGATAESSLDPAQAKQEARALAKKLAEVRKDLDKGAFDQTQKLLADVESFADKMASTPPDSKEKALLEMNKLSDALKDRQRQLGSNSLMQKQLQQMQDVATNGPADEFSKAMQQGDFKKAAEKMSQMRDKLASGKMTEKEREQLRSQLEQMAKSLDKMAGLEQKKQALEQAKKNGGLSEQQYQEEMAKLNQQSQDMQQLQKMAQQLAKAGQAMQQGDMNRAAQELGMTTEQLQELAQQAQELEALDSSLAEMLEAKAGMSGEAMNQLGEGLGQMPNMAGNRMGNDMGNGRGRGPGRGDRPEAPDNVSAYNTKTPQQYTKGAAVVTGFAPPQGVTPGQSTAEVQQELEAAGDTGVSEAMSNQKIPSRVKEHVIGYFEQIRKGD